MRFRTEINFLRHRMAGSGRRIGWLGRSFFGGVGVMFVGVAAAAAAVLAGCAVDAPPSPTPGVVADPPPPDVKRGRPAAGPAPARPAASVPLPAVVAAGDPVGSPWPVPVVRAPVEPATADGERASLDMTTGVLVIDGLDESQRAVLRIIPESGVRLTMPANQTYHGVDGIWIQGERQWFKIPAGTWVAVRPAGGQASVDRPGGVVPVGLPMAMNGLVFEAFALPASSLYQQVQGPASAAGWQTDAGVSAHPTDYPF